MNVEEQQTQELRMVKRFFFTSIHIIIFEVSTFVQTFNTKLGFSKESQSFTSKNPSYFASTSKQNLVYQALVTCFVS
jgi:hypothetical protein